MTTTIDRLNDPLGASILLPTSPSSSSPPGAKNDGASDDRTTEIAISDHRLIAGREGRSRSDNGDALERAICNNGRPPPNPVICGSDSVGGEPTALSPHCHSQRRIAFQAKNGLTQAHRVAPAIFAKRHTQNIKKGGKLTERERRRRRGGATIEKALKGGGGQEEGRSLGPPATTLRQSIAFACVYLMTESVLMPAGPRRRLVRLFVRLSRPQKNAAAAVAVAAAVVG
uniref:Uncharacterized protein n=1 Tax=Plectus sambesii TaxID=2011161 RepID=A0A914VU74_9BILA